MSGDEGLALSSIDLKAHQSLLPYCSVPILRDSPGGEEYQIQDEQVASGKRKEFWNPEVRLTTVQRIAYLSAAIGNTAKRNKPTKIRPNKGRLEDENW